MKPTVPYLLGYMEGIRNLFTSYHHIAFGDFLVINLYFLRDFLIVCLVLKLSGIYFVIDL